MNVLYELVRQPAVFGTVSHLTNASTAWPDTKTQLFLHWRGKKKKKHTHTNVSNWERQLPEDFMRSQRQQNFTKTR